MQLHPKIETISSLNLVGISLEMNLIENKSFELFSKVMPKQKLINNALNQNVYEVLVYNSLSYFTSFNPNNIFTKWVSFSVSDFDAVPNAFETLTINEGLYAIFNYKGLQNEFSGFMQNIFMEWLPNSEYNLDDRPHFIVLGDRYKKDDPNSEETIYIPIVPK